MRTFLQAEADSIVLQQLSRLEVMETDERILREQYNEDMPQVRAIEMAVRSLDEQIRLKKDEVINRNLNAKLKMLNSERERIDLVTANIEEELAAKDVLLRDLAADTSRYQAMITKQVNYEKQRDDSQQLLSEIRLMKLRSDASRVRQISLAELPRDPSFPKVEMIVPGTIVVCFGIFVGWIFLRELPGETYSLALRSCDYPRSHGARCRCGHRR